MLSIPTSDGPAAEPLCISHCRKEEGTDAELFRTCKKFDVWYLKPDCGGCNRSSITVTASYHGMRIGRKCFIHAALVRYYFCAHPLQCCSVTLMYVLKMICCLLNYISRARQPSFPVPPLPTPGASLAQSSHRYPPPATVVV